MRPTKPPGIAQRPAALPNVEDERLRLAFGASGDAVYDWRVADGRISWFGDAAGMLGLPDCAELETAAGFQSRIGPDDVPARSLALSRHLDDNVPFACEYKLRRGDGGFEWVHERGIAECGPEGRFERLVGSLRIVTEQKVREHWLERLAYYDELTGRLNRVRLLQHLNCAVERSQSGGGTTAFMVVNVDNLGTLNDAYGYDVADVVIVDVARRIGDALPAGALLGRVGGNQFGAILEDCDEGEMTDAAERILESVRTAVIETAAGPIIVTVTVGGVTAPDLAGDSKAAFGRAEEALAQAKRAGRDRFVSYRHSAEVIEQRRRSMATGDRVLRALKERRLKLAYQPIVDIGDCRPRMYESLLRMLTDDGEVISAGSFMAAVEELGLIRLVDRYTLEMAVDELVRSPDVSLTVNVSGMTAADPNALTGMLDLVKAHRTVADRLVLEITETVAMQDIENSARFVASLRALGCRVALDDFGAGYTSFRHLKSLDVDLVKIDGQFVQGVADDADNQLFVKTLLTLSSGLGLRTVAECVENEQDARFLRENGVNLLQGYLYGRPELGRPWASDEAPSLGRQSPAA